MIAGVFGQRASTETGIAGGVPSSEVDVSDDFNRANSSTVGGSWTEITGNCSISSNTLLGVSGSLVQNLVRHSEPMASLTQYMKAIMSGWGTADAYITFIFRWGASNSSQSYGVSFSAIGDGVSWFRYINTSAGSYDPIDSGAITVNGGDNFGVIVDGLGNNTVVRIWRNCTGLPVSASNWNGDTTPTLAFSTNPFPALDTGTSIGVGISCADSNSAYIDNWFGGSL